MKFTTLLFDAEERCWISMQRKSGLCRGYLICITTR